MEHEKQVREHLVKLLQGGRAFRKPQEILEGITWQGAGKKVASLPYTIWQLLEHLRITQWDILEFSRNPQHQSPKWPDGYWPEEAAPADEEAFQRSLQAFYADTEAMIQLVQNPDNSLFKPFEHGDGQTLFREATLVAEHNAYHLGETVVLRRLSGDWE